MAGRSFLSDPSTWVAAGFIIFVAGVWKPASKLIGDSLDARADRIRKSIDEAQKLREEAQDMLADAERKHRDALREAEEIMARANRESERLAREAAAKLEADLKRREEQAIDRIVQAERSATAEVRAAAVDIAVQATRALLEQKLDDAAHQQLVEAAIRELPSKLN
jgi:F-type H+-transporting ATPase subunit b